MPKQNLQKNATQSSLPPREVLNAEQTAQHYTFQTYNVSAELAPFADYYWVMRWDLRNKPPVTAEVIPSPYTNLTFMSEGARITGVSTGKYSYQLQGEGTIFGVKFKPGAFHVFYKKSLHNLTDKHIPANLIFEEIDDAFNKAILKSSDSTAVRLIEELLTTRNPILDKYLQLVSKVIDYLETQEHATTDGLLALTSLSERRLQEIFREYVGVGIKWISLRIRLIRAVELAAKLEKPDWTTIAHQLGYADQSHFTNDFKRVIGKSPTQYTSELNKSKFV